MFMYRMGKQTNQCAQYKPQKINHKTSAYKKGYFFFYIFFNVESKSEIHFHRQETETVNNPEKTKISGLLGVPGASWQKWISDLDSAGQKINKNKPELYLFDPENSNPKYHDR